MTIELSSEEIKLACYLYLVSKGFRAKDKETGDLCISDHDDCDEGICQNQISFKVQVVVPNADITLTRD